jgi:hypothetical protein
MSVKVYFPRKSHGWIFLTLLVLLLLFFGFWLMYVFSVIGNFVLLIFAIIPLVFVVPFLVILFSLRTMRYELNDEKLAITCGFLRYVIPLHSIKRITKRDLEISLWSSFRLPGLALFRVPYVDVGIVKMCATSSSKGILLIETDKGLYGITPRGEDDFVADLKARLLKAQRRN